jgi:tetratricopeptide (TPR) repeat protein
MGSRLVIAAALSLTACASTPPAEVSPAKVSVDDVSAELDIALAAMCGADSTVGQTFKADLKLAGGMGTGGFNVDSGVEAAQTWFDYGLALSHAFYHEDAKAAMRKAVEADPTCARCAWGQAWVLGPTLNFRIDDNARATALAAAERAKALVKPDDEMARRLSDAMLARYQKSEKSTEPAFGAEMARIAAAYPAEVEVAVLATHALLIPVRAADKSGLKPALAILERILKNRPNDTGAIHYYIHATEFDGRAEDALTYADRLGDLAPAASHLVHMPAHTFFRAGLYQRAAVVNAEAIGSDAKWLAGGGNATGTAPQYYSHNVSFGLAGAMMSGDAALAVKLADHAARVWPTTRPGSNVVARTWVALAVYAPERALALPEVNSATREGAYRAYARAEALVRRGELGAARAELALLAPPESGEELPERTIARNVIEGRIAMAQNDPIKAADFYSAAAGVQESRLADSWDPPAWWYPVRRSVAAAYLKAGDFRRAEAEANKSLASWEKDPLALWVLAEAEKGLGKSGPAREHASEAKAGWRGDINMMSADLI